MGTINYQERFASHPNDVNKYDTEQLRNEFLITNIFEADKINLTYTSYDRFIAGGAMPANMELPMDAIDPLKAKAFCERREVGIVNIGDVGSVQVGEQSYGLKHASFKWELHSLNQVVYGIQCHLIRTTEEWKFISIRIWMKIRQYAISWENLMKHVTSGCITIRLLFPLSGQFTLR